MKGENMSDKAQKILEYLKDKTPQFRGGQKEVYIEESKEHGKVAVKVGKYSSEKGLERAKRETVTQTSTDSPYFAKIYEFEYTEDSYVIVEEFIEGEPLTNRLGAYSETKDALNLLRQLIEALQLLWPNIVHRDMKPPNIIIKHKGNPVILDLGIARLLDRTSLTLSEQASGPCTPAYAAIEQLTNRKTDIDWRTDQFALGIITSQLLMKGQHPFDPKYIGNRNSYADNIMSGIYKIEVPKVVSELIKRMLGKEPHQRFRKPEPLIEELNKISEVL